MAASKSEVVSVRVEPPIKAAMQVAAEREMRSLANMFEVMVVAYCRAQGRLLITASPLRNGATAYTSGNGHACTAFSVC